MLDVSPANLLSEVEAAEKFRDRYLTSWDRRLKAMAGPYYRSSDVAFAPENHYFEYCSFMVPTLIFSAPRAQTSTPLEEGQREIAQAIGAGLNRWIRDVDLVDVLQRLAFDMLLGWGVALVTHEEYRDRGKVRHRSREDEFWPARPHAERVSPKDFFSDPKATTESKARFKGHGWWTDLDDLQAIAKANPDGGWDQKALELLVASADEGEDSRPQSRDTPERKELKCRDVWIPEYKLDDAGPEDDGWHGTLLTLATGAGYAKGKEGAQGLIVRRQSYYGPRWGPYVVFGVYTVPDEATPLSPICAVEGNIEQLNRVAQTIRIAIESYKHLIFVKDATDDLSNKVKNADKYGGIIPTPGLSEGDLAERDVGGVTDQLLAHYEILRANLDRAAAMNDAKRGAVSGVGTATEQAIADRATENRVGYIRQRFARGVTQILRTVGWFLYYDERVVMPLGADTAAELGMIAPWFYGGDVTKGSGYTFDDLQLTIEPSSMEKTDEGLRQARVLEGLTTLVNVAPLMVQVPWIDWSDWAAKLGEAYNMPDLDDLLDLEVLKRARRMSGPQLSGDVGSRRIAGSGTQVPLGGPRPSPVSRPPPHPGAGAKAAQHPGPPVRSQGAVAKPKAVSQKVG